MKPIVINADDFGLSDGVCRSVIELFDVGAISNTSIMTGVPGALDRVRQYASALRGKAGVHLHISYGSPLSPAHEVPSLVNADGKFRGKDFFAEANPEEVLLEFNRQIESVAEALGGVAPTHIDTHHGVHREPHLHEVYFTLARQYNLPVRGGRDDGYVELMKAAGVRGTMPIANEWTGQELGVEELKAHILERAAMLDAGEVLEVVTHPAYSDAYLESMTSWNKNREYDHAGLLQLARENWLAQNGFKLVAFPALA